MKERVQATERIREFNRFYLPMLGLLGNHYLGSEYSPTEARVLYEVLKKDGCNAAYIAKLMNIDKSYLSRIIRNHERKGYLRRTVSEKDTRSYKLHLTREGRERAEEFDRRSGEQISGIIQTLDKEQYLRLIKALDTVTEVLEQCVTVQR